MTLAEIFTRYGTDKEIHGYSSTYETLFDDPANVKRVLEIGVGSMLDGPSSMRGWGDPATYKPGASLRAWREWFPNANIVGIDPADDCQITEERITTFRADSRHAPPVGVGAGYDLYDLIVDDGSHVPEDQFATLRNYFQLVRPGGYYVIEDMVPGQWGSKAEHDAIEAIVGPAWFFANKWTGVHSNNVHLVARR